MRFSRILTQALVIGVAALGVSGCDNSDKQERYVAELRPMNEVPATTSTGVGRVILLISKDGTYAEYSTEANGLTGGIQGGHFHRGAVGVNGPIVLSFFFNADGTPNTKPNPGTTDLEINKAIARTVSKDQLASIIADLRAGNIYANVHTPNFPGGEIRGQLIKQ